jgi:hypothetical protein
MGDPAVLHFDCAQRARRIHVFHRPTGQVLDAEFKTINGHDAPTIILADGQPFDPELHEVLPFPMHD